MSALVAKVSMRDVDDVEGFIAATIKRSAIRCSHAEHEELMGEGFVIMVALNEDYKPLPPNGRFSGYAAQLLPRRLGDAWHRLHPEHRYRTRPDGKREWEYLPPPVSIEAMRQSTRRGKDGLDDSVDSKFLPASHWTAVKAA